MRHSRRPVAVVLTLLIVLVGLPLTATTAAALTPAATRYSALVQGDFTVTGNTLNQCCFTAADEDANPGSNPPASAGDTNTSSRASFSIPAGATVTKAFLYTFVDFASTAAWPSTMKIAAPGGDYQDAAMTDLGADQQGRVVYSDVTSVLGGGGDGEVWVGSPNSFADAGFLHAWGLFIVYSEPNLPWRQVVLVDQAAMIGFGATTTNATIPDLAVAPGGAADVTLAAFEFYSSGGAGQEDTLQICAGTVECADDPGSYADPSVYAQNGMNPADDIANATFSLNGSPMPGTAPTPTVLWSDLDLFEMPGALPSGTTSATVTARSVSDTIFSGFVAVSTTVFAPIAQLDHTVSGVAAPGGYLDYELTYDLDPSGDDALGVVVSDTLPGNVTYVPGSARVTAGANAGATTDAVGDDPVDVAGSTLTWRVGNGATGSVAGDVATTDGPQTLTFRVQVAGAATPGDPVTNTATATFNGDRTPSLDYSVMAESTTPVVPIPSPPTPSPLTSSAAGPASQTASTSVPVGGSVTLLDGSTPVTSVTVTGGSYSVVPSTGVITFTPNSGYTGSPTPVPFRVTDAFAQTGDSTYSPTVTLPVAPSPAALTSSGTGTATQTATATVPSGASITLLDGSTPVTTLTVGGQGTYTLDPGTGVITFAPVLGFAGTPTAATYRITDGYAQTGSSTYTPTVNTPPPPSTTALTSSAPGPAVQTVTVSVPASATVTLLDGSTPVTSLTRSGQGTYTLDPSTGVITFTPELGFAGTVAAVGYEVEDAYGQSSSSTYTPTVTTPSAPTATALTSSAVGTAPQTVAVTVPEGGNVELLDGSTPVSTLTVAGEGTYVVDGAIGTITFTPLLGYTGAATAVTYRVSDSYAQSATSSYTPTVTTPPAPAGPALTSTGTGTETHRVTLVVPPGGSVTLLDGTTPVQQLTVAGQGTYTLDAATGVISFRPQLGFAGTATGVGYAITDAYSQTVTSTYAPAVATPAPPAVTEPRSQGGVGQSQRVTIEVPPGGTITLLDGTTPVQQLTIAGQGTYALDPVTGTITFTPIEGFTGSPTPATYRVTDAYGQSTTGTYAPQVLGAEQVNPTPPNPGPSGADQTSDPTPSALAFTGAAAGSPILLGALLLALGALMLAARRLRLRPAGKVS